MKKAIIYVRVSTDKQETERQKAELKTYANMLGYEVIDILEDIESGLHDDRPQFMKLLSYTKNEIDAVLVWEISRIGRKTSTVIKTIEDWTKAGICFISKKENLMSLDSDGKMNANTKLFLSIMATIAENEANTIKERMRSGKIFKLRNGGEYADRPAFGYKKVKGKIVIDEEQAEIVREAYKMRKNKVSMLKIAAFMGKDPTTAKQILTNEAYKGIGRNKYVPDMVFTVPKIVDDDLWNSVQATFNKVAKRTDPIFAPLRNKIVCPICGRHYRYFKNNGQDRYRCLNADVEHPKYSTVISAVRLHEIAEDAVLKLVGEPQEQEMTIETPEAINEYIIALEEKKAKFKRQVEIARKKLDAVRELLTDKEINDEQNKIASLFDKMLNIDVEIDAAKLRMTNAIILASAPMLPMEVTGWWEYVKEVRVTEFRAGYKKLEIELLDNRTTQIEIEAHKGWSSVIHKTDSKPRGRKRKNI